MNRDPEPLLRVRDLARAFGGVRAVDGLSLEVRRGEIVSIIGPNGSGKTTAFNLISGLLRPDSGEIVFEGKRINGLSPDRIAELGIARTFQNGRVFGNMTVRENVLVGMHRYLRAARPFPGLRHAPVVQWVPLLAETVMALVRPPSVRKEEALLDEQMERQLARFGERLLPRREHLAYSLSYANRRRTEIARALAMRPKLLLLDEPTAGMNPTETAEVLDQLLALRSEGQTILLIEHKLDLVMKLSDRVLVLDDGKPIAEGTPAEVQNDERVVEAYLGRGPGVMRDVDQIRDVHVKAPDGVSTSSRRSSPAPTPKPEDPIPDASSPAPDPLLRLDGVDAYYGPVHALSNVSLHVKQGEIVCLLGGNASGKSTTMKVVLGLLRPRNGRVLLDGADVTNLPTAMRIQRGVASVPEARRLFPSMTLEENLRMGAYLRGDRSGIREDLQRMYELFPRLAERRRQLAGTMSGGEQQMLAMARALMSRPRLVCMDEPTMGLAPIFVERVLEMIVEINRRGISVFMVEQNASLALSIASRGYVLQTGILTLEGNAEDLLNDPAIREAYLGQRAASGS